MPDYYIWVSHEEERSNVPNLGYASSSYKNITYVDQFSSMTEMAYDAHMQPCDMVPFDAIYEEDPNEEAKKFYETLAAGNQPIYEAATKSRLSIAIRLLAARTSCRATEKSINYFIQQILDVAPKNNCIPKNFYEAKKVVSSLGMKVVTYQPDNTNLNRIK